MKFFDVLKMAFHNIWHNKSRTALTLIIIFIVGTLLMVLNIFSLSFYTNMNLVSKAVFAEKGSDYYFSGYYDESTRDSNDYFNSAEIKVFFDALKEYSDVVDTLNMYINSNIIFFSDLSALEDNIGDQQKNDRINSSSLDAAATVKSFIIPLECDDGALIEGRLWNKNDLGKSKVWITDSFIEQYYKNSGTVLKLGDEIAVAVFDYSKYESNTATAKVEIAGIFDAGKVSSENYYGRSDSFIYIDYDFLKSFSAVRINSINMGFYPNGDFDFSSTYSRITSFLDAVNKHPDMRKNNYGSLAIFGNERLSSNIVSQMKMSRFMGIIVIGLIIFISLVIVLLSAGSIANSIIISTDKNKKFIGLMKALGLKTKGVNRIINTEAVVQILLGIVVSFLILLALSSVLTGVLDLALGSIFKSIAQGIPFTIKLQMPFYIPLAVFAVFLAFALLSARGSLRKMGKMDPIAIMSEVS